MPRAKAVNHHYFDELNERSAWVLGFWAADGCVYKKGDRPNSYVITFAQSDRDLLEKIQRELESEHKLGYYAKNGALTLQFCSVPMKDSLCHIFGVDDLSRKSSTLPWPTELPDDLFWPFLRGAVDGDGCFYLNNGQPQLVLVCGSQKFLSCAAEGIEQRTGIIPFVHPRHDGRNFEMTISGVNASIVAHELYRDATIWSKAKKSTAFCALWWKTRRVPRNISEATKKIYADVIPFHLGHGRVRTSSGYREVERLAGRWRARFNNLHLGYYDSAKLAAMARDRAAIEKYGPCAVLNCPKEFLNA